MAGPVRKGVNAVAATLVKLAVNKRLPDGHHHVSRLDALRLAAATIAANYNPQNPTG